MAATKTVVTELITGLGMLGYDSMEAALAAEPREMVSVSPEMWKQMRGWHAGGALRAEFASAFANGQAFLAADDGLRGRRPLTIEWKGAVKAPGDEVVPADLRVDHVYLVSCKYLSKIVHNASPSYVFERLLAGRQGQRSGDWFVQTAPRELEDLYRAATDPFPGQFPERSTDLQPSHRELLGTLLPRRWSPEARPSAVAFAKAVAATTAQLWMELLSTESEQERLLWRLLRIGSAPYFVLGSDRDRSLRMRVQTAWDWRQEFRLRSFGASGRTSEQPVVDWVAEVEERSSGARRAVAGHVEIRWSHKKFCGAPEAKVHLDTPHQRVPGYVTIA